MGSCVKSLLICTKGKTCSRRDSAAVLKRLRKIIKKQELGDFYEIQKSGCLGLCRFGPMISVDYAMYGGDLEKLDYKKILKHHSKRAKPVKPLKSLKVSKKK
jgi:NADH:ubiquinone oxidoreductase subunit E